MVEIDIHNERKSNLNKNISIFALFTVLFCAIGIVIPRIVGFTSGIYWNGFLFCIAWLAIFIAIISYGISDGIKKRTMFHVRKAKTLITIASILKSFLLVSILIFLPIVMGVYQAIFSKEFPIIKRVSHSFGHLYVFSFGYLFIFTLLLLSAIYSEMAKRIEKNSNPTSS